MTYHNCHKVSQSTIEIIYAIAYNNDCTIGSTIDYANAYMNDYTFDYILNSIIDKQLVIHFTR